MVRHSREKLSPRRREIAPIVFDFRQATKTLHLFPKKNRPYGEEANRFPRETVRMIFVSFSIVLLNGSQYCFICQLATVIPFEKLPWSRSQKRENWTTSRRAWGPISQMFQSLAGGHVSLATLFGPVGGKTSPRMSGVLSMLSREIYALRQLDLFVWGLSNALTNYRNQAEAMYCTYLREMQKRGRTSDPKTAHLSAQPLHIHHALSQSVRPVESEIRSPCSKICPHERSALTWLARIGWNEMAPGPRKEYC